MFLSTKIRLKREFSKYAPSFSANAAKTAAARPSHALAAAANLHWV